MTGYIIHYTDSSGSAGTETAGASSTGADITGLTGGETYTISVEATSVHMSGESEEMIIALGRSHYCDYPCNHLCPSQSHLQTLQGVWWLLQGLPQSQCPGRQWLMLTDILSHSHVQQELINKECVQLVSKIGTLLVLIHQPPLSALMSGN